MSDYGDEMSDGDEWFYVEEEYMVADELAEHAVQSPPPTTYMDDSNEEWDRFEYFIDIDYASDGYDDVNLEPKNGAGDTKIGKKRKRSTATAEHGRKKHKPVQAPSSAQANLRLFTNSPVVWRSQCDRDVRPRVWEWEGEAESYALMKDWREKVTDTPQIARQSSHSTSPFLTSSHAADAASETKPPGPHIDLGEDEEDEEEEEEEGGTGLDPAALLAVLQQRLAAEGGPLSGMDPEQIMQFALRMANGEDSGDDVVGQMADEMLDNFMGEGDGEEEDGQTEANLASWIAQKRNTGNIADSNGDASQSTEEVTHGIKRPLTPPPSQATRSMRHKPNEPEDNLKEAPGRNNTRKRKAASDPDPESSESTSKKRATKSYAAPTTTSQAKAVPPKTTRSGRKR